MGNLNKFYLMGRVARAPEPVPGEGEARALIPVVPGTGFRAPRGRGPDALMLLAAGPQVGTALALRPGQSVLLRGQLQQELRRNPDGSERSELVALVQAIDLIADGGPRRPRPPREDRPEGAGASDGEGAPEGDGEPHEHDPGEGGEAGELDGSRTGRRPRRRRRRGPRREGPPRGEGGTPQGGPHEHQRPEHQRSEHQRAEPAAPPPPPPPPPRVAPPPDPTYRSDMPF